MSSVPCLAAPAPIAKRSFTLNKSYETVLPLIQLNAEMLEESLGSKTISKKLKNIQVNLNLKDGLIEVTMIREKELKLKIRGEETTIKCEEHTLIKKGKIQSLTQMVGENEFLKYTRSITVFTRIDDKSTKVDIYMWVGLKEDIQPFFVRIFTKAKLRNFEREVRDIVGDPLPEPEEETSE